MILRAGLILTLSNVSVGVLNFLRNILVARLISVEDFGVAATFIVMLSIMDLLTGLSLDRMVVQARDGDDPHLIAALQGLGLVRSAGKAVLLFLLAWPTAWFFGHPELTWAYQLIAGIPLIRSFIHGGVTQQQRRMQFGSYAFMSVGTAVVSIAAVYPTALWLGDYRVMLVQIFLGAVITTIVSHLTATTRFRLAWDWTVVNRAFGFGWPLMINGGLLFIIMQGDRMVVGNRIGPYELGLFSAALTLAMTPSLLAARITRLFFMPLLARRQDDGPALSGVFVVSMQTMILAGAAMAAAMTILGPWVFDLAYGARYAGGLPVLVWLSIMFSMRLIRDASTTVAMSCGRTRLPMAANAVRLVSLPLCFWAAGAGWGMVAVVMISTAAEVVSLLVATTLLWRWLGLLRLDRLGLPYALAAGVMGLAGWIAAAPPLVTVAGETVGETAGVADGVTAAALRAIGGLDWRHAAILVLLAVLVGVSREVRARALTELTRRKPRRAAQ